MRANRYCNVVFCFILLTILSTSQLIAQDASEGERVVPEVRAYRINPHAPEIDGQLDDPVWKSSGIDLIGNFTQREPDDGLLPTESTLVAVAYDDDAIYVAFWCYDSEPDNISKQLVRRDRYSESDQVSFRVDPFHDHQSGFYFCVNTLNVQRDAKLYNEDHMDMSWNAVWESGVRIQPWGWSAEMKIPYHCIRFAEKEEHTWGVDFTRLVNRKDESTRWAYTPIADGGMVSNFGHLTHVNGIAPARHIEILPYAVSSLETEPKSQGNPDGRGYMNNVGVDIKYGITSNLTLDAAINPDFGQVELDSPTLNLSTFESYFPERRPFFIEGSNLYRSEFNMFYSRRIGRSPRYGVDDDDADYYIDYPKATTILGAAKLTGKLSSGTSIAFLSAVTDEEDAEYMTTGGEERRGVVEPQASYSVFRVKQDVMGNSSVGGILTLASQDTYHPSLCGGLDWRLTTSDNVWRTKGQIIFSRNDDVKAGYGADLVFEKISGRHVRGAVGYIHKTPELDINRLGFMGRSDQKFVWSWFQYRTSDDWWWVRNTWTSLNWSGGWNFDGNNIGHSVHLDFDVQFINNWHMSLAFSRDMKKYDDRETRGNGLWEYPYNHRWWFQLSTDRRKKFSVGWYPDGGYYRNAAWWAQSLQFTYRPAANIELDANARYSRDYGQNWWVSSDSSDVAFANMNQEWLNMGVSASVVFSPNLSVQMSAQGLITSLDYYNYRPYLGSSNYGPAYVGHDELDYNWSQLNSTLLVRYEYSPGSTLYLVWTRSRPDYDPTVNDFDLSRDFDRFFSSGASNVFLIKASHWLNM